MRRSSWAAAIAMVAAMVGVAAGQEPVEPEAEPAPEAAPEAEPEPAPEAEAEPEPAPEAEPEPAPEAAPVAPPGRVDGWALYHRAFSLAARGDNDGARALLTRLTREAPTHPAAARARDVLRALGEPAPPVDDDWVDPAAPEKPTKTARAELALAQTFHGLATGIEICLAVECDEPALGVFLALGGAAGGTLISLAATKDGLTPGRRALLNSGTFWGAYNGAIAGIVGDVGDGQTFAGLLLLSQYAGLGLGAALAPAEPTDGQVALANTVAVWSAVLAVETYGLAADNADGDTIGVTLIAAADAGLLAGAVAAQKVRMSRGRTIVIDSGGILGGLMGLGGAILAQGDSVDRRVGFGSALAGTAVGLAAATYLSRHWDAPPVKARVAPIAIREGFGGGVAFDL